MASAKAEGSHFGVAGLNVSCEARSKTLVPKLIVVSLRFVLLLMVFDDYSVLIVFCFLGSKQQPPACGHQSIIFGRYTFDADDIHDLQSE